METWQKDADCVNTWVIKTALSRNLSVNHNKTSIFMWYQSAMSQYQCYMKYTYGVAHLIDDLVKSELLKQLSKKQRICNKCRKSVQNHLSKKTQLRTTKLCKVAVCDMWAKSKQHPRWKIFSTWENIFQFQFY